MTSVSSPSSAGTRTGTTALIQLNGMGSALLLLCGVFGATVRFGMATNGAGGSAVADLANVLAFVALSSAALLGLAVAVCATVQRRWGRALQEVMLGGLAVAALQMVRF